jgi:hypothetical protein
MRMGCMMKVVRLVEDENAWGVRKFSVVKSEGSRTAVEALTQNREAVLLNLSTELAMASCTR